MFEKLTKKHPVQFGPILWEMLSKAAAKESVKRKKPITVAEYVRQVVARHLKAKGAK